MRDKLKSGEKITLYPVGKEEGIDFIIESVVGEGHSCVVYNGSCIDEEDNKYYVRIKEYYPEKYVDFRDSDNYLCVEEFAEEFAEHLEYFERGYKVQMQMRLHENLTNSVSNIQGIYENYGTKYIVTTYQSGGIYTYHLDKNMYELFKVMKAVALVVSEYHKLGFLHLDIKPDNIFKLKETSELVIMFDFDSFVRKDELSSGTLQNLSYTKKYAAPELVELKLDLISEQTDIYAIGLIAYERLTSGVKYDGNSSYDLEAALFKNVNPKVIGLLNQFFEKTLSVNVQDRYANMHDMLADLDKILKVCQPSNPFIVSNKPVRNLQFVGREDILEQIHDRLKTQNVLCLHGIGGIGKTEIANEYLCRYHKDYEVTRKLVYSCGIKDAIVSDSSLPIHNFMRLSDESEEAYYHRKLNKLQELCDGKVLFIIDNFDTEDDEHLMDLLSLDCDFIFTSRYNVKNEYFCNMEVPVIEREGLLKLFGMFCHYREEEEATVLQLLELVERHTMSVELIAKQVSASNINLREMYSLLTQKPENSLQEAVSVHKDGRSINTNMFAHIQNLFLHNNLNESAKRILVSMTFFGNTMIELSTLQILLKLENYDAINQLERQGWIKFGYDEQKDTKHAYLHPIIKEFIMIECKGDVTYVKDFFSKIAEEVSVSADKTKKEEGRTLLSPVLLKNILIYIYRNEQILFSEEDCYWVACVWGSIGDYLLFAGDYLFMLEVSDHIIALKDKVFPEFVFLSWYTKALIHHNLKNYKEEIECKLQSVDWVLQKMKEERGALATLYYELGICYSRLGDKANAMKYYALGDKAYFRHPFKSSEYNESISTMKLALRIEVLFHKGKVELAKKLCRALVLSFHNSSEVKQYFKKVDDIMHVSFEDRMYDTYMLASELMILMGEKTKDDFFIEQGKISKLMLATKKYGKRSLETTNNCKEVILHHIHKEEYIYAMNLVRHCVSVMREFYAGDYSMNIDFWYEVLTLFYDKKRYDEIIRVYEYNIIGDTYTDNQVPYIFKMLSYVTESYLSFEKQTEAQMAYLKLQQIMKSYKLDEKEEYLSAYNNLKKMVEG